MNNLNQILGAEVLSEEVQANLQEAFDKKVSEATQKIKEESERTIREEFAKRYEHDKGELVEAMDRMLSDVISKYATARVAETAKLKDSRQRYSQAVKESRAAYRSKMKEHLQVMRKFVLEQVAKEIGDLRKQETALAEERKKIVSETAAMKDSYAEQYATRVKKIDEFVVRQVSKELKEFDQDKRALVETRVKLVRESRAKLQETQKRFIKEAAKKVDKIVSETLKNEMTQLHEELERNRQNMFGRRIFEAISAEFMSSYLAEGTATKKLAVIKEQRADEIKGLKQKLAEASKLAELAQRKTKLAEDITLRTKVMNELLTPLSRDKRVIMSEMLDTVKTPHLREAYNKYLPTVLNENGRQPVGKTPLNEVNQPKRTVTVTGDQRNNRLLETVQAEDDWSSETAQILRLAGVQK